MNKKNETKAFFMELYPEDRERLDNILRDEELRTYDLRISSLCPKSVGEELRRYEKWCEDLREKISTDPESS